MSSLLQRHEPALVFWQARALAAVHGTHAGRRQIGVGTILGNPGGTTTGREVAADEPPQKFKIVSERRLHTREPIPRAAMLAQPLHNAEVAMSGSCTAGSWNPFTAILVGKEQHSQVATSGCSLACS